MDKNITQAVILAGGRGERLRPLTDSIPKPMAPINGVPFLDYLINSVIQAGIGKILILLGYKADLIADRYKKLKASNTSGEADTRIGDTLTADGAEEAYKNLWYFSGFSPI